VATMIGCLPTQALAFLAVFIYATHATQAIAFGWKPGLIVVSAVCGWFWFLWCEQTDTLADADGIGCF